MGETARAANFSLRGYERPTNAPLTPYLKDIVYYKQTFSCGTSTAVSVPCTFSAGGQKGFVPGTEAYTENLLDVLEKVGYKVLWRENNTGCQNVCDRVELEDPCKTGKFCLDEVMLDNLAEKPTAMTAMPLLFCTSAAVTDPLIRNTTRRKPNSTNRSATRKIFLIVRSSLW